MRSGLAIGVCACALLAAAPPAEAEIIERIVAIVNDDIILDSELNLRIVAAEDELDELPDQKLASQRRVKLAEGLLDAMVAEQLIAQQAVELKLRVTSAEVDKAIDEVRKQNKVTLAQLERALREEGFTMAQYRADVKKQILRLKVINVAVRSRIAISDADIEEQYDRRIRQSDLGEVKASHIFVEIPADASEADLPAFQTRAAELTERAKAGEDFATLARENSDDPATKEEGGDLGWIARGLLPDSIDAALFSMKQGEIRGPLRGEGGFHVFKMTGSRKAEVRPLAEVKEKLREELYQQELKRQTRVWLDELKRKAYVKKRL